MVLGWQEVLQKDPIHFFTRPQNFHLIGKIKESGDPKIDAEINQIMLQVWGSLGTWDDGIIGVWRLLKNFEAIQRGDDLGDWEAQTDRAILICAGPSVDGQWDWLQKFSGKNIAMFSVDTMVTECVKRGLKLDGCFSAERIPDKSDAVEPNKDQTWFISAVSFAADYIKKPTFVFRGSDKFCEVYPGHRRKISKLIGVCVSPFALASLYEMGFKEVWLFGQDLCFDPATNESHAEVNLSHPSYGSLKTDWPDYRRTKATNWLGNEVDTTTDWVGFQRNINVILQNSKLEIINFSPYGLPLCKERRMTEFEAQYLLKHDDSPKIKKLKVKRIEFAGLRKKEIMDALRLKEPMRHKLIGTLCFESLLRPLADYEVDKVKFPKHTKLLDLRWKRTLEVTAETLNKVFKLEEFPQNIFEEVDTRNSYCRPGSAAREWENEKESKIKESIFKEAQQKNA